MGDLEYRLVECEIEEVFLDEKVARNTKMHNMFTVTESDEGAYNVYVGCAKNKTGTGFTMLHTPEHYDSAIMAGSIYVGKHGILIIKFDETGIYKEGNPVEPEDRTAEAEKFGQLILDEIKDKVKEELDINLWGIRVNNHVPYRAPKYNPADYMKPTN